MFNICLIILLVLSSVIVCRALFQQNIFIKLLLINISTSIAVLFFCFLGLLKVNSSYIDIALIYMILSFITISSYLKYFTYKNKKEMNNVL